MLVQDATAVKIDIEGAEVAILTQPQLWPPQLKTLGACAIADTRKRNQQHNQNTETKHKRQTQKQKLVSKLVSSAVVLMN